MNFEKAKEEIQRAENAVHGWINEVCDAKVSKFLRQNHGSLVGLIHGIADGRLDRKKAEHELGARLGQAFASTVSQFLTDANQGKFDKQ